MSQLSWPESKTEVSYVQNPPRYGHSLGLIFVKLHIFQCRSSLWTVPSVDCVTWSYLLRNRVGYSEEHTSMVTSLYRVVDNHFPSHHNHLNAWTTQNCQTRFGTCSWGNLKYFLTCLKVLLLFMGVSRDL